VPALPFDVLNDNVQVFPTQDQRCLAHDVCQRLPWRSPLHCASRLDANRNVPVELPTACGYGIRPLIVVGRAEEYPSGNIERGSSTPFLDRLTIRAEFGAKKIPPRGLPDWARPRSTGHTRNAVTRPARIRVLMWINSLRLNACEVSLD
jgi:hypothetical protein